MGPHPERAPNSLRRLGCRPKLRLENTEPFRMGFPAHSHTRLVAYLTEWRNGGKCPTLSSQLQMKMSWLIDSRGLAKKVINAGLPDAYQIKDCGANTRCPKCQYLIDNSDISHEWPGLPAGVKFDPSDVELLDHLSAKRGVGKSEPHVFIDEFIPTLKGGEGICYTHPENLPGAKKDGSSVHFFYRIVNAYASGKRKRRRVQDQESTINVRWHKTGKTKPVMENGFQKGFKKIMVLYATSKRGRGSKSDKCNWVMHQYHLGTDEDEKEGEYVVSKIFYQPEKETDKNENSTLVMEESDVKTVQVIPVTPMTTTPNPPRQDKTPYSDCFSEDDFLQSFLQDTEPLKEPSHASYGSQLKEYEYATCLGPNSEAVDLNREDSLLCNETYAAFGDLDNLELDTPPDFQLTDLQFDSQDSVFGW